MLCLLWIDVVHIFDLGHKSDFRAEDSLKLAETAWSKLEWNQACYAYYGLMLSTSLNWNTKVTFELMIVWNWLNLFETSLNGIKHVMCAMDSSLNLATKVTFELMIVWNLLNLFEASLNGIRHVMLYVNSCCPHLLIGPQKWQSCWR